MSLIKRLGPGGSRILTSSIKLAAFDKANAGRKKIHSNQTKNGRKSIASYARKHKDGIKMHARNIRTYQRMGGSLSNVLHTK